MAVRSKLLRVLLSIALILNGIGSGVAATRMHANQMSDADHSSSAMATSATKPCHQHQGSGNGAGHPSPQSDPDPGKATVPDCCASGLCACACAHAAQVALLAPSRLLPVPSGSLVVKQLPLEHAAPALPHLIRPPIG